MMCEGCSNDQHHLCGMQAWCTYDCAACHAAIDLLALVPWGDGQHTLPCAPWICACCAALGIVELETGEIVLPPEEMWQVVQERNPVLWQEIVETRARIRRADHA